MEIGLTVYGIFRQGQQASIRYGEVVSDRGGDFTVKYPGFHYTYNQKDLGRHVFLTEDEAEDALEKFRENVRMGYYD